MTPEIIHAMTRFQEEMEEVDDVAHALLKGHLLIEEGLNRILEQYFFHREHLDEARLTFHMKVLLARGLCLRKNKLGEWELIAAINSLRNTLAHSLKSHDRDKKLANVKAIYFREASGFPSIEEVKKMSDVEILKKACGHCGGFLSSFEGDSKELRKIIWDMDRGMNPDQPPFDL